MKASVIRALFGDRAWRRVAVGRSIVIATSPQGVRHYFLVERDVVSEFDFDYSREMDEVTFLNQCPLRTGHEDEERPHALIAIMRNAEQRDVFNAAVRSQTTTEET